MKSFVKIHKGFLGSRYLYIDCVDEYGPSLFKENGLSIKRVTSYAAHDKNFVFVMCKVKNKDVKRFEDIMLSLPGILLDNGYIGVVAAWNAAYPGLKNIEKNH